MISLCPSLVRWSIPLALMAMLLPTLASAQSTPRTILINGFASNLPAIGYGMKRLKRRIPNAKLYSYFGALEGWTYIAPKVLQDVRKAHRRDPYSQINLIGVSFGANLLTRIVAILDKEGIQVNYLGILDGLPLTPVTPNVDRVDNFTCIRSGCLRDKVTLTRGNTITVHNAFSFDTTHIELPNNEQVHRRILSQIDPKPINIIPNLPATSGTVFDTQNNPVAQ